MVIAMNRAAIPQPTHGVTSMPISPAMLRSASYEQLTQWLREDGALNAGGFTPFGPGQRDFCSHAVAAALADTAARAPMAPLPSPHLYERITQRGD